MNRPCPSCPDGNEWGVNGPTGRVCMMCNGTAYISFEDDDDDIGDLCPRCGGDGFIMAADGDPTDWGEDTYCGPDDEVIGCRACNGTGIAK